jgi:hypothetical protein
LSATEEVIDSLKREDYSINTLILKNGPFFWKIDASNKIKKSQMVLFVLGENSHKSPYIAWEIKESIKLKKPIYILKLNSEYKLHTALFIKDSFSNEEQNYGSLVTKDELISIIKSYNKGDYGLFNSTFNELNQEIILEQYKLFLQTSEDLVNRRQNVNSFYISISSALIAIMGVFCTFDFGKKAELVICFLFCLIGIIISVSWSKILSCYGNLNSSKMKIISNIEKKLPLSLFDAEWAALSDKLNKKKYISFTETEKIIPLLFEIVYLFIIVLIIFLYFF